MSRLRVVIENITPQIDGGRFAAKRIVGRDGDRRGGRVHRRPRQGADAPCSIAARRKGVAAKSPMTAARQRPLAVELRPAGTGAASVHGQSLAGTGAGLATRRPMPKPDPELTLLHEPPLTLFRRTASARRSPRGTSSSRAPPARSPASTARSRTAKRGCPTSPRWASTCCICRRSIPSARPSAKAPTTR